MVSLHMVYPPRLSKFWQGQAMPNFAGGVGNCARPWQVTNPVCCHVRAFNQCKTLTQLSPPLCSQPLEASAGLQQLSATLCDWTAAGQPLAAAVGKLTRLTGLRLSDSCALQDQELAALLGKLSSLQRLELAECFKLTELGMQNVAFPSRLTALQLSR